MSSLPPPPPPPPPQNRRWGGNNRRNAVSYQQHSDAKGKGKSKGGGKGKQADVPGTSSTKGKSGKGKSPFVDGNGQKGKGGKAKARQEEPRVIDDDVIGALQDKKLPDNLLDAVKQHLQAQAEPMDEADPLDQKEVWQQVQSIKAKLKALESSIDLATTAVDTAEEWLEKQRDDREALYEKRDALQDKLEILEGPLSHTQNPIDQEFQDLADWTKELVRIVKGGGKGDVGSHDAYNQMWPSMPTIVQAKIFNDTRPEFDQNNSRTNVPWIKPPTADLAREPGEGADGHVASAAAAAGASRRARGRAGEEEARSRRRSASRSPPPADETPDLGNRGREPGVQVAFKS